MPRVLKEKMAPLGPLVAVVSFAVLLRGAAMPSLETQLMVVTLAWQVLMLLQCILGPKRRHSRHWFVQYGAMAAYYLPFSLAVYAANTVRSSSSDTNLQLQYHLGWCVMLLFFSYSCPAVPYFSSMSTYTLGDSLIGGSRFFKSSFCFFFLLQTLDVKQRAEKNEVESELVSSVALLPLAFMGFSLVSAPMASDYSGMASISKAFADYMKREANSPSPFFHDAGEILEGCRYPITKLNDGQWIKISDLLRCGEPDILLSYSFFRLLTRRHFGFDCAEEGNPVVRDFVLKELLLDDKYNYKRAFIIVEKQLALLHDYLFTTYLSMNSIPFRSIVLSAGIPFEPIKLMLQLFSLLKWLCPSMTICWMAQKLSHIAFAVVLFVSHMVIWWFQNEIRFATDAYTVWVALRGYLTGRVCSAIPSRSDSRFRQPYWKNEIGQYSLIEDYDRCLAKRILLPLLKACFLAEWPPFMKHFPMEEDAVRLDDSVRELVALTLRDINGPPTDGTRSLLRNRHQYRTMDDLSWTCREDTYTHTILIWHIATCYCGMSPPENLRLEQAQTSYQVATTLSKYCAYLVAFLPKFLPGSNLNTQMVFQDVLQQAKKLSMVEAHTIWEQVLRDTKDLLGLTRISIEEKLTKIREMKLPEKEVMTTFEKGVKLGRQLEQLDTSHRWEVMAEFWAEAILYIAPSDNADAHCEHLAKGGEFITHLWALLSNAGILKRASDEPQWPDPAVPANE